MLDAEQSEAVERNEFDQQIEALMELSIHCAIWRSEYVFVERYTQKTDDRVVKMKVDQKENEIKWD